MNTPITWLCLGVIGGFGTLGGGPIAQAATPEDLAFFEREVRPLLVEHCTKCHGPTRQKAGLRLDSRSAILQGGTSGPAAIAGQPKQSRLLQMLRAEGDKRMPFEAEPLTDPQWQVLSSWIERGLPWPDEAPPRDRFRDASTHWAFQPVRQPSGTIDDMVQARLDTAGIEAAPRTDRRTLLRRLYHVITGLPPGFAELEAFANDPAPHAETWAREVDRLLASPHYGERWGRHWLDLARYSDTKGYVFREDRNYPYAYTYRDWVVQALNQDMPYDRFLSLQVAADRIEDAAPGDLAAMGFLTVGRRFLNRSHDIIDDRIDVVTRTTLGLTVACARCHDHPFDPVQATDYYGLFGIFNSTREPESLPLIGPPSPGEPGRAYEAELTKRAQAVHAFAASKIEGYKPPNPEDLLDFQQPRVEGQIGRKEKDAYRNLLAKVRQHETKSPHAPPRAMVLVDKDRPVASHVLVRGNPGRRGEPAPRRFIQFLAPDAKPYADGSGRLELARDLVDPANPLTARVIVNRTWQHHFGRPLVDTPSDFGLRSEPPSHPEVLDLLAAELVQHGWSLKHLHRTILLSETWQRSSQTSADALAADPENRWLGRAPRRRLDFEALRDAILDSAGTLDRTVGGKPSQLTQAPFSKRRAIYGHVERQNLPNLFRTFDFASPDSHSPTRPQTTTPQQALFLMNSPFLLGQAAAVTRDITGEPPVRIRELYRRVLRRDPTREEAGLALDFIREPVETPWSYGYLTDGAFQPFPWFGEGRWSGSPNMPDEALGWRHLTAGGGHPERAMSVVRRWTAPADLTLLLSGSARVPAPQSNGIRCLVISGEWTLADQVVMPGEPVPVRVEDIKIAAGEHLDFVVEDNGSHTHDSFQWAPVLQAGDQQWSAAKDFSGPRPSLQRLAQILLCSNEFSFID